MAKKANEHNILEKLHKIKELAERGEGGEKENAIRILSEWVAKYKIKLGSEEIEERKFYYENDFEKNLFYQVMETYFNKPIEEIKLKKDVGWWVGVYKLDLNPIDFILLSEFWEWHRENWRDEFMDTNQALLNVYCTKHHLFPSCNKPKNIYDLPKEDRIKHNSLMDMLNDKTFNKLIES